MFAMHGLGYKKTHVLTDLIMSHAKRALHEPFAEPDLPRLAGSIS
jgi:hypothetical protein